MGKTVAVSFEENDIKVVRASVSGRHISIESTETLDYGEFDAYLQREKAKEFIVTYDFKEAYHDVLTVPVLKPKYQKKIIESEIRKATNLTNISFIYTPLREEVVAKRKMIEIFYFAVNNEVVQDVVGKFYDHNKVVKAVYPTVFSAASLIRDMNPDDASMGIFTTGQEKIVFYTRKDSVQLIRNYESLDADLSNFDIQNINMTISYCVQNLRSAPLSVILLGSLSRSTSFTDLPSVPLSAVHKTQDIDCNEEIFHSFFLPISSLSAPKLSNVLSSDFRKINIMKAYMSLASFVFAAVTMLCLGILAYGLTDTMETRRSIREAAPDRSSITQLYAEFREQEGVADSIIPVVNFLNRATPEIQPLFAELAGITVHDLAIISIDAGFKDGTTFAVSILGAGHGDKYAVFQSSFSDLLNDLQRIRGVQIRGKSMNLIQKTFRIDFDYRTGDEGV